MFIDNQVTRFENGVTNRPANNIFNSLRTMDPTLFHTFFDDFDTYTAAQWVVTETQAGATQALANGDGGLLLLTNTAADNDLIALQKVGESFLFRTGKKIFFKARLQISEAVQSDMVMGLQITDATPLDVTDGVFFQKDDGDANLDFYAEKNNVQVGASAIAVVPSATFFTTEFYWDGVSRIYYGVDGAVLGYITPAASLPDDEDLTISFAIQNGEAAAKNMTVDYVFAAAER